MKPLNVLIQPRSGGPSGSLVTTRFTTGGSGAAGGLGGNQWESAIVRRPRLTLDLFSPALDGKTQVGRGDLVLNQSRIKQTDATVLYWQGAPITIYDVTDADITTAPVEFTGYVKQAVFDPETDQILLTFEVSTEVLDKPLLYDEFTGGGGITGAAEFRGKKKPAGFGTVQNVEPVWFDPTNNIGMIDGYGNCTAITALFEGGNDFGTKVADYATYAALVSAITGGTVKPGQWATCVALGLVGLGAPPAKTITVDATFGTNRPGALMQRILTVHAGVSAGNVETSAFNALDTAVNRPTHYWTNQDRTCRDLLEAVAASCNGSPVVTFQGKFSVVRAFGGTNIANVDRQTRFNSGVASLGANVIQNGDYASSTGHIPGTGCTISGGVLNCTAGSQLDAESGVLTIGQQYQFSFDYNKTAGSKLRLTNSLTNNTNVVFTSGVLANGSGTLTGTFTATGTACAIEADTATYSGTIDNWVVQPVIPAANSPRWTKWRSLDPDTPTWRMSMRAKRPGVVLDVDQILYTDDLIDKGLYSSLTTYRQGNLVWAASGAQYLYINANPAAAAPLPVPPATSTAYWSQTKPPTAAGDLLYADGTTIQSRQPAQAGVDNRVRFSLFEQGFTGYQQYNPNSLSTTLSKGTISTIPYIRLQGSWTAASQQVALNTDSSAGYRVPVTGGERLFAGCGIQMVTLPAGTTWELYILYNDSAGAFLSSTLLASNNSTTTFNTRIGGFDTAPAAAQSAYLALYLKSNAGTSGAWDFILVQPMICSAGTGQTVAPVFSPGPGNEAGAQVTTFYTYTTDWTFEYDSGGTAQAGQFPKDFAVKLSTAAGQITSGLTWYYQVKSGTVNGFTNASGVKSITGSGTGTFTVSSLGTDVAEVYIWCDYQGRSQPQQVATLRRHYANPPAGGGGGSTTLFTQTAFSTSITSNSFVVITSTLTAPTGNATVNLYSNLTFTPDTTGGVGGPWTIETKWQRNISGTWTDIGAPAVVSGQTDVAGGNGDPVYPDPVLIQNNKQVTGLSGANDFRMVARATVASPRTHTITGSVSGTT